MLKLIDLVENRPVVVKALEAWQWDEAKKDILNEFRISATAIYPFYNNGSVNFLRLIPKEERSFENLMGEYDLLTHMSKNNFNVPNYIKSLNGHVIETIELSGRQYYASVFTRVCGTRMDEVGIDEKHAYEMGKTMADFHINTIGMTFKRESLHENLSWMRSVLEKYDMDMIDDLNNLERRLMSFGKTKYNYGIIHYDFEPDNLFYDHGQIGIVDFDDAHEHFYVQDIINAQNELEDQSLKLSFLEGYKSLKEIDIKLLDERKTFEDYSRLMKICRLSYALDCKSDNPEEWMVALRERLEKYLCILKS